MTARVCRCLACLAVSAIFLLGACACRGKSDVDKSLTFTLGDEPRQLDPQVARDKASVTVLDALFVGLTTLDDQGVPQPGLSTWVVSDDDKVYTFTLRESLWSNGELVTADDVVYGLQRAADPATGSPVALRMAALHNGPAVLAGELPPDQLGVEATDERTVIITLDTPDDRLLATLALPGCAPCNREFFMETAGRYGLEAAFVLSNGPFQLKRWSHGESLLLVKNEGYVQADAVLPETVRYRIGTVDEPLASLMDGSLSAAPLSAQQATQAAQEGLTVVSQEDTVYALWFNCTQPALARRAVRQALRGALVWEPLRTLANGGRYTPAAGWVTPDARLADGAVYRTDGNALTAPVLAREEAAALLRQGLEAAELETFPTLKVLCADDDDSVTVARYIVQSWQKNLALYCGLETVPAGELAARLAVGNYAIAVGPYTAGGAGALDALEEFTTGAAGNVPRLADTAYDALAAAAAQGGREALEAAEAALWEACPGVPLCFEKRYVALGPGVSGVTVRPFDGGRMGAPLEFLSAVNAT